MVDKWIRDHQDEFPEEVEIKEGGHLHLTFCFRPTPIYHQAMRVPCDGSNCTASLEFEPGVTGDFIQRTLERKGWNVAEKMISCPRCSPAAARRN
jgi:hypothetical protein